MLRLFRIFVEKVHLKHNYANGFNGPSCDICLGNIGEAGSIISAWLGTNLPRRPLHILKAEVVHDSQFVQVTMVFLCLFAHDNLDKKHWESLSPPVFLSLDQHVATAQTWFSCHLQLGLCTLVPETTFTVGNL